MVRIGRVGAPFDINYCPFPENLLYDLENLVWVEVNDSGVVKIGATSILAALAGKLTSVKFRPLEDEYEAGRSLGTIESATFIGALRTPLTGKFLEVNRQLAVNPRLLNDFPYDRGWFARLSVTHLDELNRLKRADDIHEEAHRRIAELHVRCFKAYPDHELYEIGVECSAVLVHLSELMARISQGDVVHIVSDDPTAYVEMVRWTEQTGNRLVDWREEGKISHFLVAKSK